MSRYIDADAIEDKAKQYSLGYYEEDEWAVPFKEITSAPSIDIVRCAECRWARPRTLKGETGYRCVFYRVDKAENGYCDNGEREGE